MISDAPRPTHGDERLQKIFGQTRLCQKHLQSTASRDFGFIVAHGHVRNEGVIHIQKAKDVLNETDIVGMIIFIQVNLELLSLEKLKEWFQLCGVKASLPVMPMMAPAI